MKRMAILLVFVWGLACTEATAWRGKYKDGPFASYQFGGDVEDEGYGFGWGVVRTLNKHLSLEGTFSYHEDKSRVLTGLRPGITSAAVDLEVLGFSLTGRAGFRPSENTFLYAGAGLGFFNINSDTRTVAQARADRGQPELGFYELDVKNEWGAHYVVGAELALTERWETFLEFRRNYLSPEVDTRFAPDINTPTQVSRSEFDYDFGMIRWGINYRF